MSDLLKNVSFGNLLRSVFAGIFFVLSFLVATKGWRAVNEIRDFDATSVLLVSLFAGVISYGLHRSIVYALLEYFWWDTEMFESLRTSCPSIRTKTVEAFLTRWERGSRPTDLCVEVGKHITVWADYTHLKYVAPQCIFWGALVGTSISPGQKEVSWLLVVASLLLFLAAAVSDWRLRTIEAELLKPGRERFCKENVTK